MLRITLKNLLPKNVAFAQNIPESLADGKITKFKKWFENTALFCPYDSQMKVRIISYLSTENLAIFKLFFYGIIFRH